MPTALAMVVDHLDLSRNRIDTHSATAVHSLWLQSMSSSTAPTRVSRRRFPGRGRPAGCPGRRPGGAVFGSGRRCSGPVPPGGVPAVTISDVSHLPDLTGYLDDLLRTRERRPPPPGRRQGHRDVIRPAREIASGETPPRSCHSEHARYAIGAVSCPLRDLR